MNPTQTEQSTPSVQAAPQNVPVSLPKVAYFCMEMAIDQSLHTYSGGLGFLAGSHMRSAGQLKLPMVGVTILWSQGYGDQQIGSDGNVEIVYKKRDYDFLKETGVTVDVEIYGKTVKVKALLLEPETFDTVPVYYLTTDIDENDEEARHYTNKLYDGEERVRIAQEIILGIAGLRALKAVGVDVDVVHMNEGHALPAVFEMLRDFNGNYDKVRQKTVFTTHTPVAAGNETHPVHLLAEAGFFVGMPVEEVIPLGGEDFSLTVAALRMSRKANGVSQLHGLVANNMWQWVDGRCPIVAITNAVNKEYWQDARVRKIDTEQDQPLLELKKEMKKELFAHVAKTTGKQFDPDVLTIVWARRFTAYKRSNLIFRDMERIKKLCSDNKVQLLFSGKFHPKDTTGRDQFNQILKIAREIPQVAVLTGPGYELELSGLMKRGSDVWLNTPTRPLEASGTSGMSANLNGTVHFSIHDGWAVEGTYHGLNGFLINLAGAQENQKPQERDQQDYECMMDTLENTIIPMYYNDKAQWAEYMRQAIRTAEVYFNSDRMLVEYYVRLYQSLHV